MKRKKCKKHIFKDWCVNCNCWAVEDCISSWKHQDSILKCVRCGEFKEIDE